MNYKKEHFRCRFQRMIIPWMALLLLGIVQDVCAQNGAKKTSARRASKYSYLPSGYSQVGSTQLYYKQYSDAIDMMGYYNGYYYSSTYSDYGYKLSVQVGSNSATRVDCLNGTTVNGVTVQPSVEQQGELARICYTVTNTNETDVVISLGTHADVMIGSNDSAPIERRIDTFGQTYGLTMKDGNGAQLCVLFGSGLAGVTAVSDFWFGYYYLNSEPYQMVGNYSSGDSYMVENGYYDSGMGWCWKNRTITAGSTVVFSYVIGVGEVNLEPNSTFEVTPDDPEGWNDLSRPHRLTLNGSYESPAGLDGVIDYAVEDSEEWIALTDTLASGDEFTGSLVAMFDATKSTHVIKFRTRDLVGNTTLLHPIEYKDVSFHALTGIEEKTYTGDSLFQVNATCDLDESQYELKTYRNNINAGTASFNIEGVFPYTIGRKTYTFAINPQPFSGELQLSETSFVYNGQTFTPDWQFSNANYANLEYDKDYTVAWSNNRLPGTGILTVTGKNNYTGSLTANISIDKAPLADNLFIINLPNEDITYDEQSHGASITKSEGVGEATITYLKQGDSESTTTQPTEPGDYAIYLGFADGSLYYGRPATQVGSFSIYQFNAEEWAILQTVLPQLTEMGWSHSWDASQGMKSVSSIQGLNIEKGHVTGFDLANQNLTGTFPFAILALPQLQSINLANNKLSGDIGTATYAFAQQHPEQMANIKSLNISGNQLTGNVSLFANSFPSLTSLNASENCLEDVYPTISPSVTELDLSKQAIARIVPLHLANLSVDDIATKVPSILLYDHANQTWETDINLQCTTDDNSWGMTMAYQNGQLSIPYVSEQNTYYGESGDTLNVAVLYNNGTREGSTFRIKLSFDEGDGNFDGQVNVLDLQTTINYMFEEYTNKPYNFTAANLWKDEVINVQDAVSLVNILLEGNSASAPAWAYNHSQRVASITSGDDATVFVANGKLVINAAVPVSSFDIVVATGPEFSMNEALTSAGFTCSVKHTDNEIHLVGYSLSGTTLPVGENVLGTLNGGVVTYSMLADTDANEITTAFGATPTGINPTTSDTLRLNEVYCIPLGAKRSIVIDANGKKYMVNEK
jgi:Leucine-rich repeat (LRR) protein